MKILLIFLLTSLLLLTGCDSKNSNNSSKNSQHGNDDYSSTRLSTTENEKNEEEKEEQIASYSTVVNFPEDNNRQINMSLCCEALNGTIVKSGEEFSFCNTVGQATPEKGYKIADVFDIEGNISSGYGGGKCQISTTLYNAVLEVPTLEVTERHPHTRKVYYVEEGKDACISYGGADLKFKNNSDFDIKIYATNKYNSIDVSISKIPS